MHKETKKTFEQQFEEHVEKKVKEKFGKAWEERVEKRIEEKVKKVFKEKGPAARRVTYAFSIFFNLLFLWVANNVLNWQVQWVTQEWSELLTIINVSIGLNVLAYWMFWTYDKKGFYYAMRLVLDAMAIYVSVRMYQVFPFAFEYLWDWDWLNRVGPWLIILGIVGIGIGIIVRTAKLVAGKNIYD